MNHLYDEIPELDLNDFNASDSDRKNEFVRQLGAAYNDIGFVAVKNHGLSDELRDNLYAAVRKFFFQSDEVKAKYEIAGLFGQRGYTGKGKEHAKGRTTGDLKEFYHVGQEVAPDDGLAAEYPDNIWPEEVPEFKDYTLQAYQILENAGKTILQAIALYLGLEEYYFDSKVEKGNSI
jgi:isopenicillin N synthase-like dioxygenase